MLTDYTRKNNRISIKSAAFAGFMVYFAGSNRIAF